MTVTELLTSVYRGREVRGTAGVTSNTVPWELLESGGLDPVLLNPQPAPTPLADRYMEDVFEPRYRRIADGLLARRWPELRAIVIPRTSEQEHKLFLYLRELQRKGQISTSIEILLYNLLQSDSAEARAYGIERTRELFARLGGSKDRLDSAVRRGNQARAAVARLLQLRSEGKASGAIALPLLGAFYFLPRDEYSRLAQQAAEELSARAPSHGPVILVKGSPLDQPDLHQSIESYGPVVAAEDDWWGSRIVTAQIAEGAGLLEEIYAAYREAVSPRKLDDGWFEREAAKADGVVFYLSPDDDVLGWDYPRWRSSLESRSVPNVLVRNTKPDAALEAFARGLMNRA